MYAQSSNSICQHPSPSFQYLKYYLAVRHSLDVNGLSFDEMVSKGFMPNHSLSKPPHLWHMKISILNLLMVLIAVAAIFGMYRSRQANLKTTQRFELLVAELKVKKRGTRLEGQNRILRQELGSLTITEPKQIHAVKLRSTASKTWSYRVYLPEGANN